MLEADVRTSRGCYNTTQTCPHAREGTPHRHNRNGLTVYKSDVRSRKEARYQETGRMTVYRNITH
jgi:hypothetical protein